ncbi:hypothetical protein ACFL2P_01660 [Candidatus Moduliflexota bacterium]
MGKLEACDYRCDSGVGRAEFDLSVERQSGRGGNPWRKISKTPKKLSVSGSDATLGI